MVAHRFALTPEPCRIAERRPLLSILVPAYQEERTIGELLRRVRDVDLAAVGYDKEIVVCDDGSRDATTEIVEQHRAVDERVRLVAHRRNRGKGAAIRSALAVARGELCLIQDADLEYDVGDYLPLLRRARDGAPVVYGSRFLRRRYPEGMQVANFVANRLLTLTANRLFGLRLSDEATCYKLFRTEVLRDLGLRCEGFEFCPEVTAKLALRRVPIVEVPISYRARSVDDGKKVRWTDAVQAVSTLVKAWALHRG
jgi:dolichol-phosphate mannosyltransferase